MELIYIGESFYADSGTIMSSIYDLNGNRQDWGSVEVVLGKGESVHIRPATYSENTHYQQKLKELLAKQEKTNGTT